MFPAFLSTLLVSPSLTMQQLDELNEFDEFNEFNEFDEFNEFNEFDGFEWIECGASCLEEGERGL